MRQNAHQHVWGEWETARFTGNPFRRCIARVITTDKFGDTNDEACPVISLDDDDA